ncbi:mucin-5AC-like [Acanthochromis polyacanthus]|uniref:mucin-5AC-like n=1 Tax=Acanthochromis polyacanthus TaxID=80966 RepID=UPI002234437C|nr:mucin-5AC-like [Acanthochromis polyacanthus]XP_051808749.1 mucin-5AC-like [Acanthochromis polyacanthus]
MFSSKFLSGANPLNAVSSAVNKFGLFGDEGEGNKKPPPQQGVKPAREQQPGVSPGKDPQQNQGPPKPGQGTPMQKSQTVPKQGSPQLQGNGQTGPSNKPAGQQAASNPGTQPAAQLKGEPPKNQPKGPQQQGSPKPEAKQQVPSKSGAQPESPKASSQQQVPPKTKMQQQGPAKTGAQQQQPAKTEVQRSTKVGTEMGQQQQGSPKPGQQKGGRTTPQQQGTKGPGTPGSSSPATNRSQPKAGAKSLCPVCNTTELNVHTKDPPNYKNCTQCKTEVCSLCGFSPPDSDGREWLCLTCQIKRAQGTSEPPGPPMKKPTSNQTPSPAAPVKKETSAPGSPQRLQSTSTKVPAKGEAAKGPESQKQASPATVQKMTPETQKALGSPKPSGQPGRKQSSATPAPQQESGGLFGFGGAKTEAAKPEESVTGKMFGFGSSIFSSASTLIASAVQDEPKTTPPVSPKMQPAKDTKPTSAPKSEQDKKQQQPQQAKAQPAGQGKVEKSETPKAAAAPQGIPKADKSTCPICKMVLNVGSKDPPNYNSCTDCKSTVCNQCGFNPMPNVKEGNEWLCLNCQVKRAAAGIEPQRDPSSVNSFKKTPPAQPAPQKTSSPGSPQKKGSTPAAQPAKAEAPDSHKQGSPAPGQTKPQESQKTGPQQPVHKSQTAQKQGNATAPPQRESGGFFGFGGGKTQPEAAKPAESVTGKMFGFGSSIFSSASTLMTSAVQDESKITPPVSPKMSPAKDPKSQTLKKQEQEKKPEQPQQAKGSPSVQPKADKPQSEPLKKASASPVVSKAGQSTCPLCKLELNVGSKDPPNYNTCTECKNTVCNQCGFNPMPNVKEVKEWLCLNCQMQRALGASEPPGTPMMKLQASPNKVSAPTSAPKKDTPPLDTPPKKDIPAPAESKVKEGSPSGSPVRKPQKQAEQSAKTEAVKGPESQKQVSPTPGQKTPQQGQKMGPQKPPDQAKPNQTGVKKSSITSTTQEESGGFFGFGGPKPQPDAAKPAESIGGKMFGFGSSIFSSASTLINSAVQDESKTTPPVSPKMPAAKASKSPPVQKPEQEKKPEQVQQPKTSPLPQAKVEKGPSEPKKDAAASPVVPKAGQSTCPLCKVQLNFGSKEPPNYNKCTECQNTVCNQCGFNPMPNVSEVKEWLCLNCQMQRALSASELTGPPMKPNTGANKIAPSAVQQKITAPNQVEKKGSSTPGSPQKTPPAAAAAAATPATKVAPAAKGPDTETKTSPAPGRKTPVDILGAPGSQKLSDQTSENALKPTKADTDKQPESGMKSVLTGPKAGPDASKTTESVSGKVFGFGSSIFSSASNLISSAVQDESRMTPPGSRKMSAPAQVSPKMSAVPKISPKSTPTVSPKMSPKRLAQKPEQEKKLDESKQVKEDKAPAPSPKAATVSQTAPAAGQTTCPLCKVELNIGSKQPPNYNTCTECKAVVCNQCGFNPMPIGEVKEWLCLDCQMKRAVGAAESLGPPTLKPQTSPNKVPSPAGVQLQDSPKPTSPQKKPSPDLAVQKKETSEPVSPQRKQSTASAGSGKSEPAPAPLKQASPASDRKMSQEKQITAPEKLPDQASQAGRKQSNASTGSQQETGGFFGFGGPKPQPDAAKPADSVTGKMFGFGSSIFSSASTLITSAVQDQPKTTPPVSPKMSPAKDPKSPAVKKPEEDKKPEQPQQAKGPTSVQPKAGEIKSPALQKSEQQKKAEPTQPTKTPPPVQAKVDKAPSEPPKPSAVSQEAVKPDQSTCPLCKVKLNIGSKDLPNYNTCTECKNTVCNQCGFNPMPNETGAKEWLCLTCQMQRALGAAQPPEVTSVNAQTPAKPQKKDISSPAEPEKKQSSTPQSPQRKLSVTAQPAKSDATDKPEVQKKASPVPSQKIPQEPQKTTGPSKSPEQPRQAERKHSSATATTQKESGGFFGFGGGKAQPEAEKPAESVTGKMFGFGSSIFSSASTLITSTVQDQPKTTPPVSPKLSPAKEIKSPAAQEKKKPEQPQQTKASPQVQAKVEKAPSEPPKAAGVTLKPGQSSCTLCKAELNMGSKDPPNYNMCTECKNTVCNQCGFNTMPNESETKEWLCLTCQMQRALKAAESVQPPLMKPQASPNKVPAPAQKDATAQKAEVKDKTQKDSPAPGAPQKKTDTTQPLTTTTPPAKGPPAPASATTKEEKPSEPPAKEVPTSTAPPSKETGTKVSDPSAPLPAQALPVITDIETSIEKKKDLTQPNVSQTKAVPQKTEDKAETVQKTAVKSSDEVQPQQAKEPQLVETSLAKTGPPATQPEKQESGSFFSFGSPKSQRSASITTEAVTGKMMGFGSSIFSSASNLITSAVQDESRTPPRSRKMSAPPVSDRKSELQISPKPSPPASPKVTTAKEVKPQTAQKPEVEKIPDQTQEAKAAPSGLTKVDKAPVEPAETEGSQAAPKVGQSTCPLCKVELNMDFKNPPNYNTCTECKTTVCSKCGFSPMPNVTEAKEWLCLNCQMQRALGASEPPGLPMIKPQPSPSKEVPVTTEKKETPVSATQEDIPKPSAPKTALAEIATAKETDATKVTAPTNKVTPAAAPLPDKTVPSTITKTDVSPAPQKPSAEKPKQPGAPQQQTPKVQTTSKPAAPPQPDTGKPPTQQPPKAGTSPAKTAPPPAQPAKQESGGFFGFGAPKTPPTAAKSAESVTGKVFGFGSSFLSSASTLITSAVQDESKTPPTPRKMSTASVSPKTTPPASPKTVPPKDTKSPAVQKTEEKKPEKPQQAKTPSTVQAKVDKAPSELPKAPADTQGASKADQSTCPLCKVELNLGSKDLPNYNTCTECKTTVCNQCGFNPMPNVSEVKEWLCLNCQMQRALGASEPTGPAVVKPQPSPSKVSAPQKETPVLVQKEKPTEHTEVQKEATQTTLPKKEAPKAEAPVPTVVQKTDKPQQGIVQKTQEILGTQQRQAQDKAGQQIPVGKPPQTTKPEVKPEAGKIAQQPPKSATPPAKSAPPPAQPTKQESGGFFGFGAPKTPPTAVKSAESVTGKMFGFGSSFLSSASTLITSAVQDESKTTPPTPRKMSTTTTPKTTPPVSPKMAPAKDTKPPATQKSEPPQPAKPIPAAQVKAEKAPPEPPKPTEVTKVAPKASLSTCPLCKVELNVGSKDPPNYNTCTECKNTVCNLCGFNPMPHTGAKEWLCLNCQTQRALSGQLGDSGKMPQPSPVPAKAETQATAAAKKAEPKTALTKAEEKPGATKPQPVPTPIEAVPTVPTTKAKAEPTSVKMEAVATAASVQIELETTKTPKIAKISPVIAEKQPLVASTAEPYMPPMAPVQQPEATPKVEVPNTDIPKTVTVESEKETMKMDIGVAEPPKAQESKPDLPEVKVEASVFTTSATPMTTATAVPTETIQAEAASVVVSETETKAQVSVSERSIKEVQLDDDIKLTKPAKSLQQIEVHPTTQEQQLTLEVQPVKEAESKEIADKLDERITDITSAPESQPVLTKSIMIEDQDENKEKLEKKERCLYLLDKFNWKTKLSL